MRVGDCTTPNFQSLLSVVDPASSWAAKWQHLSELYFDFVWTPVGTSAKLDVPSRTASNSASKYVMSLPVCAANSVGLGPSARFQLPV